ncbi:MAG: hypothetical protein AB4911_03795 [Oscillochloridaceae bacterium umkhey_bin13]
MNLSSTLAALLSAHGDRIYQVALLIAFDQRGAARLLRLLAADLLRHPPLTPLDEPALLTRLVALAREQLTRRRPMRPGRPPATVPALYRSLLSLPFDQRVTMGLHLLAGYDGTQLGRVMACEPAMARATLITAARTLGPAVGTALTDRTSGDLCLPVRDVLADPASGSRQRAEVRGHLSGCSLCRSFDQTWSQILPAVEAAMRQSLREASLPNDLRIRMLAATEPRRMLPNWPQARMALAPLAVLGLIAAIVLPGFLERPVQVVERSTAPAVDPADVVERALARQDNPPRRGGIWRMRASTIWYFADDVYAPLVAEAWFDPQQPARHRLQLSHADGGAPYELQVSDGAERLVYALDLSYARAIYGSMLPPDLPNQPMLLDQNLAATEQLRAREARLASGPWALPQHYLRQAQSAPDLRLLGRQQLNGRNVQIISFSGISPLGLPPDTTDPAASRITILLALDSEDGLLRRVTELVGPAGTTQISRITWSVDEDEWLLGIEPSRVLFAPERAWTGVGTLDEAWTVLSADYALPLIPLSITFNPADLLRNWQAPLWLPTTLPNELDRALLVLPGEWDQMVLTPVDSPRGLTAIYLGPNRRLIINYRDEATPLPGESLVLGPWRGTLTPGLTQRYRATLLRPTSQLANALGQADPSRAIIVEAQGLQRDELLAALTSITPLSLDRIESQTMLFQRSGITTPEARRP